MTPCIFPLPSPCCLCGFPALKAVWWQCLQPSPAAMPHRSRVQMCPVKERLPAGLLQGEGGGKARGSSPCSLRRALLQPQPHHLGGGTCTPFELALPGTCPSALGSLAPENRPFPLAHPFAQLCAAAAPTLTCCEQPAFLQRNVHSS